MKKELEGKFKTAAELNLMETQYCGLLKTLVWLEEGGQHERKEGRLSTTPREFNMTTWGAGCGTACCIAGSARAFGSDDMRFTHNNELQKLFLPDRFGWSNDVSKRHPAWKATPAQGAQALRGFLETGKADWDGVMGVKKS